jgi:hypothetical protein
MLASLKMTCFHVIFSMGQTDIYAINHWPALSILNFSGEAGHVWTGRQDGLEDCHWK